MSTCVRTSAWAFCSAYGQMGSYSDGVRAAALADIDPYIESIYLIVLESCIPQSSSPIVV